MSDLQACSIRDNFLIKLNNCRNEINSKFKQISENLIIRQNQLLAELDGIENKYSESQNTDNVLKQTENLRNEQNKVLQVPFLSENIISSIKHTIESFDVEILNLRQKLVTFTNIDIELDTASITTLIDKLGSVILTEDNVSEEEKATKQTVENQRLGSEFLSKPIPTSDAKAAKHSPLIVRYNSDVNNVTAITNATTIPSMDTYKMNNDKLVLENCELKNQLKKLQSTEDERMKELSTLKENYKLMEYDFGMYSKKIAEYEDTIEELKNQLQSNEKLSYTEDKPLTDMNMIDVTVGNFKNEAKTPELLQMKDDQINKLNLELLELKDKLTNNDKIDAHPDKQMLEYGTQVEKNLRAEIVQLNANVKFITEENYILKKQLTESPGKDAANRRGATIQEANANYTPVIQDRYIGAHFYVIFEGKQIAVNKLSHLVSPKSHVDQHVFCKPDGFYKIVRGTLKCVFEDKSAHGATVIMAGILLEGKYGNSSGIFKYFKRFEAKYGYATFLKVEAVLFECFK